MSMAATVWLVRTCDESGNDGVVGIYLGEMAAQEAAVAWGLEAVRQYGDDTTVCEADLFEHCLKQLVELRDERMDIGQRLQALHVVLADTGGNLWVGVTEHEVIG